MNFRELTALILLYDACSDETLQRRVEILVPEIADAAGARRPRVAPTDDEPRKYIVSVYAAGPPETILGAKVVTCRPNELQVEHEKFGKLAYLDLGKTYQLSELVVRSREI